MATSFFFGSNNAAFFAIYISQRSLSWSITVARRAKKLKCPVWSRLRIFSLRNISFSHENRKRREGLAQKWKRGILRGKMRKEWSTDLSGVLIRSVCSSLRSISYAQLLGWLHRDSRFINDMVESFADRGLSWAPFFSCRQSKMTRTIKVFFQKKYFVWQYFYLQKK